MVGVSGSSKRDDVERAWAYASASDDMLHRRMDALLISQAFLAAGYFQIFSSENFLKRPELSFFCFVIIVLATAVTYLAHQSWMKIVRGGDVMKTKYLVPYDPVYSDLFHAVRAKNGRRRWSSMSRQLPNVLYSFWFLATIHLIYVNFFLKAASQ